MDEGYIKFNAQWEEKRHIRYEQIESLNEWRKKLYDVHLVGVYDDGIGFGNVSQRATGDTFYISGSKTGRFAVLDASHYAEVTSIDVERNWVECVGETIASSESMSHAVIYQHFPEINAVFHVHNLELWEKLLWKIPTTPESAPYGSPEMAHEILTLFQTTHVLESKLFAMAGHREGLFSFGKNLDEAGSVLLGLLE